MITIQDLIKSGQLQTGDQLVWAQPRLGVTHHAQIAEFGVVETSDGVKHKSPSGAARHFYQKPIDGWSAWKLVRNGKTLSTVRAEFVNYS